MLYFIKKIFAIVVKICNFASLFIASLFMKKILSVFTLIVFLSTNAQIKILFDATKAEMAGNADWVIDADEFNLKTNSNSTVTIGGRESNPQRFPTPDQSNITSTTPENFWTGGN